MKKISLSKKRLWLMLVCILSFLILVPTKPAEAASAKTKALNAYAKMLSKTTLKRDDYTTYKTKNCYFAIAYIDNNSVPELIIYNTKDSSHAQGWGALYTYRNGKVCYVTSLMMDNRSRLGYYYKTGWFMDNVTYQGYGTDSFYKLSGNQINSKLILSRTLERGKITGFGVSSSGRYTSVTDTAFNRSLSYNTKYKTLKKFKFYKNTKANRNKYLK